MRPASAATGTPLACAFSTSQLGGRAERGGDQPHAVARRTRRSAAPCAWGRCAGRPCRALRDRRRARAASAARRSDRAARRSTRGARRASSSRRLPGSTPPLSEPTYLRGISRSTPKGRPFICSRIHSRSTSSCSGECATAPSTPSPPALVTAATTSRQCVNAKIGKSMPTSSLTRVRISAQSDLSLSCVRSYTSNGSLNVAPKQMSPSPR